MSDIIDEASEREEELRAKATAARKPVGPPACGFCYNCGDEVQAALRWCDLDCRRDWERRQVVIRNNAGRYYE